MKLKHSQESNVIDAVLQDTIEAIEIMEQAGDLNRVQILRRGLKEYIDLVF